MTDTTVASSAASSVATSAASFFEQSFPDYKRPRRRLSVFEHEQESILSAIEQDGLRISTSQRAAARHIRDWFCATSPEIQNTCTVVTSGQSAGMSDIIALAPFIVAARQCVVLTPLRKRAKALMTVFCGSHAVDDAFLVRAGAGHVAFLDRFKPMRVNMLETRVVEELPYSFTYDDLIVGRVNKCLTVDACIEYFFSSEMLDLLIVDEAHRLTRSERNQIVLQAKEKMIKVSIQ